MSVRSMAVAQWVFALCALGLVHAPSALAQIHPLVDPTPGQAQVLPTVELTAGMHRVSAMWARTEAQRQHGLMFRNSMAPHEGMLFTFAQPNVQCFWMKNTPLPLSIAFLDDDGKILNLADMQPFDLRSHCSVAPVRYILEMNRGWFAQRGIKPGAKFQGLPR